MQNAALAHAFNKTGRALVDAGHRVVIGRARGLLGAGDVQAALRFLDDAAARLQHAEVRTLSERVRAWQQGGGDVQGLLREGAWTSGTAWERFGAESVAAATQGDFAALLESRVAQQRALATGARLVAPPAPNLTEHAIGSIFGTAERPAAVVEAPVRLEERRLDLDEEDLATAPTVGMVADAVRAATVTPPPPSAGPAAGRDDLDDLEDIDLAALARSGAGLAAPAPPAPPPSAPALGFSFDDEPSGPAPSDLAPPAAGLALDKAAAGTAPASTAPASTAPGLGLDKPGAPASTAASTPAGPPDLQAPPSLDPQGAAPGQASAVTTNRPVLIAVLVLAIAAGAAAAWYFLNG